MTWFIFYHSRPFFYRMPLCVCVQARCVPPSALAHSTDSHHPKASSCVASSLEGFWPWRPWRVLAANTPREWIEPIKPCPENWMLFRTSLKPSNSMDSFVAPSQQMLQRKLFCQQRRQIMGRPVSRYPAIDEERQTYIYIYICSYMYSIIYCSIWVQLDAIGNPSSRKLPNSSDHPAHLPPDFPCG